MSEKDNFARERERHRVERDLALRKAVRELRAALGCNQTEFARLLGKSVPTIQRYEGQNAPPVQDLLPLIKLARESRRHDIQKAFADAIFTEFPQEYWELLQEIGYISSAHASPDTPVLVPNTVEGGIDKQSAADHNTGNPSTAGWVLMLERILRSGHEIATEAITRNLIAFDTLIHANKEGRSANYRIPQVPKDYPERVRKLVGGKRIGASGGNKTA